MFAAPLPEELLKPMPLPPQLARHFSNHSSQTDPRAVEQILWLADQCGSPRRW
jgi:hypothetical protein